MADKDHDSMRAQVPESPTLDSIQAELAKLNLTEQDVSDAVAWARSHKAEQK